MKRKKAKHGVQREYELEVQNMSASTQSVGKRVKHEHHGSNVHA